MWGIELIQRFGSYIYLYFGLISKCFENPHGAYAHRWQPCHHNYKWFPYAEELRSELKNKEIAFVYICTPGKDDLWQKNIMKYNIDGDNYKLTEDQKIVLYFLLNYEHGTYNIIINKNGVIVDSDADDPNSGTIKQQLLTISEQYNSTQQ